jgi:hypothetical protein
MNSKISRNIVNFLLLAGLSLAFFACGPNEPTVTGVSVSPRTASVAKGETKQFTATVKGENDPEQTVTWEVTGGGTGTSINSSSGLLTVAAGETASKLTVKATSTVDTSKSGTATVTVTSGSAPTALSGTVTISGTAQVGQTLTAVTSLVGTGAISYQWKRGNSADVDVTDIPGATSSTYVLVEADKDKFIAVTVTRSGYQGSITSDEMGPVYASGTSVPTVTTVTVTSATASVAKGETLQFNTTVTGNNSPSQAVNWSIVETGKHNNTTISTSGLLSVAAAETLSKLTVKATSTLDNTKSGTKEVTVTTSSLPALSGSVTISGTTNVAQSLTANTSSLGGGTGEIGYQWARGDTATGTFTNISGATSANYTLVTNDLGKYIRISVTRAGNSGSVTSTLGPVHQAGTSDSTSSLTGGVSNAVTTVTEGSRTGIAKVDMSVVKDNWSIISYNLSSYKDKEITVILSVDVKREGAAGDLKWQINNATPNFPTVAVQSNAAAGIWYTMSGTLKLTLDNAYPVLYLNNDKTSGTTFYYIDNFTITIIDGSSTSGGGGDGIYNGDTLNSTNSEQVTRTVNGYNYELWNQDKKGTAIMTIAASGDKENGGIYKCEWAGIKNVLFRAGKKYNETQTHDQIGTITIEYTADKFEMTNGSNNAYLSAYGWVSGGSSGSTSDNLVEYYIVDNYGGYNPGSGGDVKGTVTIDGAEYTLYVKTINGPSIKNGITTFTQYLSVRAAGSKRKSGTISVSQHFAEWEKAGMTKITTGKFYEIAFKVESWGGDTGNSYGNAEISKNILKINGVPIQ